MSLPALIGRQRMFWIAEQNVRLRLASANTPACYQNLQSSMPNYAEAIIMIAGRTPHDVPRITPFEDG